MISHILSNSGITVVFEDGIKMLHKTSPGYGEALVALKQGDISRLREIMDPKENIKLYSGNELSFEEDGSISFEGLRFGSKFTSLVKEAISKKIPWEVLARFFSNCAANPSQRARKEIETFLDSENLPITDDGCFLAYKNVTVSGLDGDHGTFDCSIGKTLDYPRDKIRPSAFRGPERGLSVGGLNYTKNGFVGKAMVVKVNPADLIGVYNSPYKEAVVCKLSIISDGAEEFSSTIIDSATHRPYKHVI